MSRSTRFNEAGAGCPGIRIRCGGRLAVKPCFNEAGAGCPGIPAQVRCTSPAGTSFNEAGAGCPGILLIVLRNASGADMLQ